MNDITLTISVSATEAAKAGVDHFGETVVVIEPSKLSAGARAAYASLCGKPVKSDSTLRYGRHVLPLPIPATSESVAEWLEANAVDVATFDAREKASYEAQQEASREGVRKWARKQDEELVRMDMYQYKVSTPYSFPEDMKEIVDVRHAKAQLLADRLNAEAAANKANAEAARAEAAKRRADQIAAWLATAPEPMRKRHARGLLPEEDIIAEIRNQAYAPLDHLPRYERMSDDDVRRELDAEDEEQAVDYTTREAESAHDEDIALMEQIESLLPSATCTLLEHAGWLTDAAGSDDPEATRYAVKVAIKVGELEFTREYAVDR